MNQSGSSWDQGKGLALDQNGNTYVTGFSDGDYAHFVQGKGTISIKGQTMPVTYPRRTHNPVLRRILWDQLPQVVPDLTGAKLLLTFR
ncbi:MAG: SBBP repeat-containing protein [Candidatus Eisenbacteria sp.]|nr:SBBP repeat-containing protein [Candidatus Eisenbacteria bacterium]